MWVLDQEQASQDSNLEGGEALCEISKLPEGATTTTSTSTNNNNNNNNNNVGSSRDAASSQRISQYGEEGGWRLLRLLERELVHPTTFTQTFLQSILSSIDSRDPVVANAWLETLLDVIDLLPADVIRNEILMVAVSKGQLSQPVASRVACCKLLGKIASKFEPYLIQQEVLPLLLSLCQDVQAEVRAGVCAQLPSLARGLGSEMARPALLPSLVEMASDEEPLVRLSAVQAVSEMLVLLDHESRQQIIVPLVRKLCEGALRSEDAVLIAVAKQLGHLCYSLSDQMSPEDRRWFVHAYLQMSQLGAPLAPAILGPMPDLVPLLDRAELHAECRRLCAFNLPAMMVFGLQNEPEVLRRIFCELASDICHDVRRTIACSLHEVSRLLMAEGKTVRSQLVGLLCDSSEEVLESLVPHLGTSIDNLGKAGALNSVEDGACVLELCRALLHCEEEISQTNNWRLQTCMLDQLAVLPHCLIPELIFTHFVPRMFSKMHKARPLPCRVTAARTLLTYLSHLTDEKHRSAVLARLNAEFLRNDSCYSRMLYLRMCPDAMSILSPAFFKQHLYTHVLTLAGDRVANIQLEVCSLLCPLKSLLRLPHDRQLLHALESCVGQLLLSAKDRDVNAALAMAIQQLDKIELPTTQHDNKMQQESSGLSRSDVGRRSISSAHRLSTASRISELRSQQQETSKLSSQHARRGDQDNRVMLSSRLRKPAPQDTRIPLSTKPAAAAATTTPAIRRLTRCLSSNSMIPPPPPASRLCSQCNLPRPRLERSHTTLALQPTAPRPLPTDPALLRSYYQLSLSLLDTNISPLSKSNTSFMDYSHIDPSTDEFYIDAGIRITTSPSTTKIPNLQDILHQRRGGDNDSNKVENVRSRLELNQISSKYQKSKPGKPEVRNVKTSVLRDNSPGKPSTKSVTPVTMRNPPRPQSASSGSRKSLNLERNITRRSLPPQDRVPVSNGSTRRSTTRPQSCLIVEPKDNRRPSSGRSLSQENLPAQQQQRSRLTVTSRIPKVNSPGGSRSTSPGIEALKYSRKSENNKSLDLSSELKFSRGKSEVSKGNLDLRLGKQRSTPSSRDPSPDIKMREMIRKGSRITQQRRPGPSYTAPSSRGSSPDSALHRLTLAPPRQGSMPTSPSSPMGRQTSPMQGLTPPRQSSVPASPSSPLPSRLPVASRYQWASHDFG